MSLKPVALWSAFAPLLAFPGSPHAVRAPAQVQLTVATIHAAALTPPRAAGDSTDAPFLLVSIRGPGSTATTAHFPGSAHLTIHQDQALGPDPLLVLSLQPGDSARVLLSLLEADQVQLAAETEAAAAAASVLSQPSDAQAALLAPVLGSLTGQGAHWLGSVALLVTNEGGTTYWRSFDCVATCRVLKGPGAGLVVGDHSAAPVAGVAEFSGAGGTYHLQLQGQRAG